MPFPVSSPSLEQLKNQARELLKAVHGGDPHALQRADAHVPSATRRRFLLADALLVIAREYGFPSWPRLKAYIVAPDQRVEQAAVAAANSSGSEVPAVRDLVGQMSEVAMRRDCVGLAEHLSHLPLRDILALRTALLAEGAYTALVDTLIGGLHHEDSRVRYNCAGALDHLADERCVEPLRALVNDPVPRVRRMALHALSCEGCKIVPLQTDDDLVTLMIDRAMTDASIQVRRHATAGLGGCCHDARVVQALESLLERDTDPAIRRNVRRALRRQVSLAAKQEDRGTGQH
jgi:HEAT repeat protein